MKHFFDRIIGFRLPAVLRATVFASLLANSGNASLVIWGNGAGAGSSLLQSFDLETGEKLQEFFATNPLQHQYALGDVGRGIAVVGDDIYYTTLGSGKIFKTNTTTHSDMGFVFDTGWKGIRSISFDGETFWVREDWSTNELRRYKPDGTLLLSMPDFTSSFDVWGDRIVAMDETGIGLYDLGGYKLRHLFDISVSGPRRGLAYNGEFISVQVGFNTINTYDLQGMLIHSTYLGGMDGPIIDDRFYTDLSFVRAYPETVPEPASLALFGLGVAILFAFRSRISGRLRKTVA